MSASPLASVLNSWVVDFGWRYPGGVGIVLGNSPNGTVSHCDVSGGLYVDSVPPADDFISYQDRHMLS